MVHEKQREVLSVDIFVDENGNNLQALTFELETTLAIVVKSSNFEVV
jgi:hypothetical protein